MLYMKHSRLQVSFSNSAAAFIRKANDPLKTCIKRKIITLANSTEKGLPLRHQLSKYKKVRLGSFGILFYTVSKNHIHIDVIGSRGPVYQ